MKILWIKTDYLHPTDRGGQIRTLEILRWLHRWHEVHFLTLDQGASPEGPRRAPEYCSRHFAVPHRVSDKASLAIYWEAFRGLFDPLPLAVSRWRNEAMRRMARDLDRQERYDAIVCDFLAPAASLDDWPRMILFQHNVEALIWQRHATQGKTPLHRWFLGREARKMQVFEGRASREFRTVITVSREDAALTAEMYGRPDAAWTPTGVDTDFFAPPAVTPATPVADLIFLGSMDWLPNVDGAEWFHSEILPRIWERRPATTLALVGRKPVDKIRAYAGDPRILVSGTVDDVRPWLHGSLLSIVPLRIGGGTRLKIYEAMAAGVATVSTSIGAEGLDVRHEENILLADDPASFAQACLDLLANPARREDMSAQALAHVRENYGWEKAARLFEDLLMRS